MSATEMEMPGKLEAETEPEVLPGELEIPDASALPSSRRNKPYFKKFKEPESDEEVGDLRNLFNIQESWRTLMSLGSCQKVMVSEKAQKTLKIEVGVNVTQEFPWKQIQYKDLRDVLFDELENSAELLKKFKNFNPEHFVLMGFCPLLTEQEDDPPEGEPFIFYSSIKESKMALSIIQNMERFDRWRMQRRLRKKPRRWVSQGTDAEMTIMVERFKDEPIDVEIQSVYPIQVPRHIAFDYRLSKHVRDGFIELLPNENIKWENVTKKRITVSVQSAPPKIDREQQTNPTFPSNAWSQYLYEIDDEDLELDETDVDEEEEKKKAQAKPGTYVEPEKKPPEMSEQIEMLLNTLDFNQIDSYRDDYSMISSRQVVQYTNPYLQEFLCFANISKSNKRFVAGYDWYPKLSGLIAVSYAFSTPATVNEASNRVDYVQRAVLEPNPVLLWSFSDNLNYKLEFEAPIENTALTFCPFNGDLLLGGSKNGQVVLWDLQGRGDRLDEEEYLTAAQAKYRIMIGEFLNWTIDIEDNVIPPTTISSLDCSPKGAITSFYWLGRSIYLSQFGKVYNDPDTRNHHKFFVTCAFDGTISFWDLDGAGGKGKEKMRNRMLPKELTQSESPFKSMAIKPTYNLNFPEPLTGIIADTSCFSCLTPVPKLIHANPSNYPIKLIPKDPPTMRQSMIVSTFYGHVSRIDWQGTYVEGQPSELINSSIPFAMVHNGPVVMMKKNPFYPELFASIGRTILAIWKEDYNYSPIFWRQRACDLTAVAWSETRPAVLYLTRSDGILEAWDILARDDDACLTEILGGGIITGITEHRPSLPYKILGIGDYNSSIRMVKLPHSFDVPLPNELQQLVNYVLKEERRKVGIQAWEQKYYELNKDIIEAKREAEAETRKEMERIEKEQQLASMKKGHKSTEEGGGGGEEVKTKKTYSGLNYNEKMAVMWDELNLNRMMTILMSRKQMDPEKLARETALEKERHAYEAAKKKSHSDVLARVDNEIATLRARILPAEIQDMQRSEMIAERVKREVENGPTYEEVCEDSFEILGMFNEFKPIDYIEFLERGRQRRRLLDQSLGGNTDRLLWFEEKLKLGELGECQFGYETVTGSQAEEASQHDYTASQLPLSSSDSNIIEEVDA
ncbi:dynein intermediate chain 3, axonemal [Drosophila eugracilis]|uniref:dynein intermediate chain 3, axonemal n=1 Tax=Drosophila eugracilis TaxID=29029 RepID=UPI0007E6750D|nr:dynein intermediate chain 3, axonemal [Drosophila eugracilis]